MGPLPTDSGAATGGASLIVPERVDLSDYPDIDGADAGWQKYRLWGAVAAWTGVSIVYGLVLRLQANLPLEIAIPSSFTWHYPLGALVWAACALDKRLALWTQPVPAALAARAAIGLVAVTMWAAFVIAFSRWRIGPDYWRVVFAGEWLFQLSTTTCMYAAGVAIGVAVHGNDRQRAQQKRELRLQVLARETELSAIRAQLQPHFLLNSLNSILALVDEEPAEARRMLTRLSCLLQSAFVRLDEQFIPLDRELETIADYLDIERIRFGDRLTFSIEADAAARRASVPPFLLQPIVENAVKHGIQPYTAPGSVAIRGAVDEGRLRLTVTDTGSGFDVSDGETNSGHGLHLTRRRLQAAYRDGTALLATGFAGNRFVVTLEVPAAHDAD